MFRESEASETEADPRLQPPSSYLLKADVPRGGRKTKTHSKTNTYIIIEFGLQVGRMNSVLLLLRVLIRLFCLYLLGPVPDVDGLVQDCSNYSANALELLLSCIRPLIYIGHKLQNSTCRCPSKSWCQAISGRSDHYKFIHVLVQASQAILIHPWVSR